LHGGQIAAPPATTTGHRLVFKFDGNPKHTMKYKTEGGIPVWITKNLDAFLNMKFSVCAYWHFIFTQS
jgi:hypothetical protein